MFHGTDLLCKRFTEPFRFHRLTAIFNPDYLNHLGGRFKGVVRRSDDDVFRFGA